MTGTLCRTMGRIRPHQVFRFPGWAGTFLEYPSFLMSQDKRYSVGVGWGGAGEEVLETPKDTSCPGVWAQAHRACVLHPPWHTAVTYHSTCFFMGFAGRGSGGAKADTRQGSLLPAGQEPICSRPMPRARLAQQTPVSILNLVTYLYLLPKRDTNQSTSLA